MTVASCGEVASRGAGSVGAPFLSPSRNKGWAAPTLKRVALSPGMLPNSSAPPHAGKSHHRPTGHPRAGLGPHLPVLTSTCHPPHPLRLSPLLRDLLEGSAADRVTCSGICYALMSFMHVHLFITPCHCSHRVMLNCFII